MEESAWDEMIVHLSQRFRSMICFFVVCCCYCFLHFFISFKYDVYVDAERMIVKTARNVKEYLRRWF